MILETTEKKDGLAIYWLCDEKTDKRICGICFENGIFNISNQSIAESFLLALTLVEDQLKDII